MQDRLAADEVHHVERERYVDDHGLGCGGAKVVHHLGLFETAYCLTLDCLGMSRQVRFLRL